MTRQNASKFAIILEYEKLTYVASFVFHFFLINFPLAYVDMDQGKNKVDFNVNLYMGFCIA